MIVRQRPPYGLPVGYIWNKVEQDALPEIKARKWGGWLPCDGRRLYKRDYPDLHSVIGTTYGGKPRQRHFSLPDLRVRRVSK